MSRRKRGNQFTHAASQYFQQRPPGKVFPGAVCDSGAIAGSLSFPGDKR